MDLLGWFRSKAPATAAQPWTLLAMGRPSMADLETRGNLGLQMLIRWGVNQDKLEAPVQEFPTGSLYHPTPNIQVFLPSLPVPRLAEAFGTLQEAGIARERIILVATDTRLPFGFGRLRLSGEGNHPMVRHLLHLLGTSSQPRLVFGIGAQQAPMDAFLAQRWSEDDWPRLEVMEPAFARFMASLETTERLSDLAAEVNDLGFWSGSQG